MFHTSARYIKVKALLRFVNKMCRIVPFTYPQKLYLIKKLTKLPNDEEGLSTNTFYIYNKNNLPWVRDFGYVGGEIFLPSEEIELDVDFWRQSDGTSVLHEPLAVSNIIGTANDHEFLSQWKSTIIMGEVINHLPTDLQVRALSNSANATELGEYSVFLAVIRRLMSLAPEGFHVCIDSYFFLDTGKVVTIFERYETLEMGSTI